MTPTKVYHVLPEAEPFSAIDGGAISRVVANMIRDDPRSMVVAPRGDDSWGLSQDRVVFLDGLAAYHDALLAIVRLKLGLPPFFRLIVLRQLFQPLVRRVQAGDIVWVHSRPEFAAALSKPLKKKRVRLVLHMHTTHLADAKKLIMRKLNVDLIAFVSEFTKKLAEPKLHTPARFAVIYNGADPRLFFPRVDAFSAPLSAPPKILFVGRLVPGKGAHIFIGALRILESLRIPVAGVVVGSPGFDKNKENEYSRSLQLSSPANVRFEPYTSGPALQNLFRSADILCAPFIWDEAFGLVNVEAMASGLAVITTNSGGVPEVFANGGAVIVERNSEQALADAIRELLADPIRCRRLKQDGISSFQRNFTWQHIQDQYGKLVASMS